jgi:hypothetical protein
VALSTRLYQLSVARFIDGDGWRAERSVVLRRRFQESRGGST